MNKECQDHSFKQGQEVQSLFFAHGEHFQVGRADVERITVCMEPGQMAGVPWFCVWENGEVKFKVNAALVETVNLKP